MVHCHQFPIFLESNIIAGNVSSPSEITDKSIRVTRKHAAHALVVEALRAVDDDDIVGHSLAQILDCLRLACARRPLGAASTV